MDAVAIVNPVAGGGRSVARWRRVQRLLETAGMRVPARYTSAPGDAVDLTRQELSSGHKTIIAVGGDGTVHDVVNGIDAEQAGESVKLAVVPAGTGMDFARNLGLARRPDRVAGVICAGRTELIDVGLVRAPERHLFVNFAEMGLGAAVVAYAAAFPDFWPGRFSFMIASLQAAMREANGRAKITVDGEVVYDGPLVSTVVANGRYFGGGMQIAPRASVRDGLLDVLILGDFSRAQLVSQIWKIYPGTHVRHPKVLCLQGKEITVVPGDGAPLDLDGELHGSGPFAFALRPSRLQVVC